MGHEDINMALDVYSSGLNIEPLTESINKLSYGDEVDTFIKDTLKTQKTNPIISCESPQISKLGLHFLPCNSSFDE